MARMTQGLVYINDQILKMNEAKISLFDLGLMRGFGIFDYLRTYNLIPFHLDEHLQRLQSSAKSLGISLPHSILEIKEIISQLLEKSQLSEASIKIIVTGGESDDGISLGKHPTLAIIVYPFSPTFSKSQYEKGIALMRTDHTRFLSHCKTLFYLPAILALEEGKKKGFDDALYIGMQNEILETTTSNFFAIKNQTLLTPKEGILPGITRDIVLKLAKDIIETHEKSIYYNEIPSFSEAFITASNKEIVPVVRIDSYTIKDGLIGEFTKKLMRTYSSYARSKSLAIS